MKRLVLVTICVFSWALLAVGQGVPSGMDLSNYGIRIEADKRLIVVLAALEMAEAKSPTGRTEKLLDTPLSDKGSVFRESLRGDYQDLPDDLRRKISIFVSQHKKLHPGSSDAEVVAPFISMAYALTPVPDLADPVFTADLPGPLLDVLDFAPLAREFYRRSGIAAKLDEYARGYISDADTRLRSSAREMVSELLDYLHTRPQLSVTEKIKTETKKGRGKTLQQIETREQQRRFVIVPEKLAPKGNITFLNIKDDYFVIVPPDTELNFTDARRAFLQFVVDPLILSQSRELEPLRAWAKPALDERRKLDKNISPDVFLAISRSLVAAIDVRQMEFSQSRVLTDNARRRIDQVKTEPEKLAVSTQLRKSIGELTDEAALRLFEDYEKGAVLSFYFAEQLKGIEDSGFDISSSLKEMLASFDPQKETGRLASSESARKRALAARDARRNVVSGGFGQPAENPLTRRLREIQRLIDSKDYVRVEAELKLVLAEYPSEPRTHFTAGRVASLQAANMDDPERQAEKLLQAKEAYSQVLRTSGPSTDKSLLSLTYVALAKIYEYLGDPAYALRLYEKAIELDDVTGGAFGDALAGKQRLLKRQ